MFKCEEVELEEGSPCPQPDCSGHMEVAPSKNCSCHISPPCGSCVDAGYVCDTCKWESSDREEPEWEPPVIHRREKDSCRNQFTSTAVDNPFNSTPFTVCCRIAAISTDRCPNCGAQITHHDDGLAARRREVGPNNCLMCGKKRGNPAIAGNCHC